MKMQNTFKRAGWLLSALMATVFTSSAEAGLKYWTTGNYDADSYVQDGLVLHYDGIRNAGIDQPHSTTTTTWVNLANPGTQDLTKGGSGKNSKWLDDGFFFDGTNYFGNTGVTIAGPRYETETLIDAKVSDHVAKKNIGYVFFTAGDDNKNWTKWSLAVRNATTDGVWFNTHYYTSDRPKIKNTDAFTYLTMMANDTYAAIFSGLTEPTGATGRYGLKSGTTSIGSFTSDGWGIGGNPNGGTQQLIGTVKSFRHYSRVLSVEERTWNRAVDDVRFFGALPLSVISTTNAVIASSIASVSGNEKAGVYAVDTSGYTFSAPASTTVDGRTYTCAGYTLETWDDTTGTWGAVQTESGTSVAVTASDRVRITWQWTGGDGIVTRYTTADYVQNGLVFHYDGIRNVGADQPHSYDTTMWRNLVQGGGYDLAFRAQATCTKPGEWRADGYRFENQSTFVNAASITLPANRTIQIALDGNALDQYAFKNGVYANEPYLYYAQCTFGKGASISLRKDFNTAASDVVNTYFDWTVQDYGDSNTRPRSKMPVGAPAEYVTAILADDFGAVMTGTTIPNANTSQYVDGASRRDFTKGPSTAVTASTGFAIGGNYSDTNGKFKGTIKNFRFYNRVLTNEELAQNRVVDDYRFHGVMPVTNVIVTTSHSFLAGNEASGNYEISGSYTFSAPAAKQTDSRGFEYTFAGYTLETWDDAAQGWSEPVATDDASSYTYTVGTSPAKVRLTWRWNCTKALRTAADFGLEDVVPNGLVLHYDGIKNIGAECDDVTNPTNALSKAWVNLVDPDSYTLSRKDKTVKAGVWDTDGFAFENLNASTGSWFQCNTSFTLTPAYTFQFLADARVANQHNASCTYLMFNSEWKMGSLAIRTTTDYKYALYYVPEMAFNDTTGNNRPKILDTGDANSKYTYATAIINGRKAMLFAGTDYPTDNVGLKTAPNAATAQTLSKIQIGGGYAGNGTQDFTGKIKSVRYYDRVLTPDEMVRNRNVDSVRYFGALATTNVFVVAGGEGAVQAEAGAYKVEGEWTFTASKTLDKDGNVVDVVRYSVETLDNGVWKKRFYNGNSYTYTEGTDPATVRLTWLPEPLGTVILVK